MSDDVRYGFAVGRVRALETTLFDRARYGRLIRAADADVLLSALGDTYYSRYLNEEGEAGRIEQLCAAAEAENRLFFHKYCLDAWVSRVFEVQDAFHNLKVLLKEQLQGVEHDPSVTVSAGCWSVPGLPLPPEVVATPAPAGVGAAVALARAAFEQDSDPVDVDLILDRAAYQLALELARPSVFLSGYLSLGADLENLRTVIRLKALDGERAVFDRALLPGGTLRPTAVAAVLSEEWDSCVARFRLTVFAELLEEGSRLATTGSALADERVVREMRLRYLLRARYATFGFEPLVGYFLFRRNEIRNLRLLGAAKSAGLDEGLCQELVAHAG